MKLFVLYYYDSDSVVHTLGVFNSLDKAKKYSLNPIDYFIVERELNRKYDAVY